MMSQLTQDADELLLEQLGRVLVLTLNRPENLNALNPPLMRSLNTALRDATNNRDVGAVVLTGAGRGFCAGGDVKQRRKAEAAGQDDNASAPRAAAPLSFDAEADWLARSGEATRLLFDMPKTTIAMINGPCAGAGLNLAGACDLRFAAHSAVLLSAFAQIDAPGDYGGPWIWSRLLGQAKARELFMLGGRFPAQEALQFGLVNRVFDDERLREETLAVAEQLSHRASIRYLKADFRAAEHLPLPQYLDFEASNQARNRIARQRAQVGRTNHSSGKGEAK
ncbi:MAG: enoyl-CoA hydratase/isomerase family protein [Caulobacteraceae bacterium]|nr:enoyl-CoA hydratase/isomerase family protein [Caulobacteraceae bacterium]